MSPSLHRFAHEAMGTRFELVLEGASDHDVRPVADAVFEEIQDWHDRLSVFDRASEVSNINASAGSRAVRVSRDLFELLSFCAQMYEDSCGAFDVTVAPLMRSLGLHHREAREGREWSIGFDGVELDADRLTVRFRRPGMALDLGGVGKGHAIDGAGEILRSLGVGCAFLHGGTSTGLAIGAPRGQDGWGVALSGEPATAPVLRLRDRAFAVSAPHGRTVVHSGAEAGHVLDPVSAEPVALGTVAFVTAEQARVADAWSTALVVLGSPPAGFPANATAGVLHDDRWTLRGPGRSFTRGALVTEQAR